MLNIKIKQLCKNISMNQTYLKKYKSQTKKGSNECMRRGPGGWGYTVNQLGGDYKTVFVPFNEEFRYSPNNLQLLVSEVRKQNLVVNNNPLNFAKYKAKRLLHF